MFEIAFNLHRDGEYKTAKFCDKFEKDKYVHAEDVDPACKNLWLRYQAAKTLEDRKDLAKKLDETRWNFYKKYSGLSEVPSLKPLPDDFPA